ncbi:NAD(P)/FAD-dependent oxidoreductase [Nannocystis radixulma]|uniref:NAD(P)/FAD-dependent oxidoreductase n=1 Tax=Nannocystis radixulma TaxID=2995305 RepID=A0ABT5AWV5_9BACT|nr:NAD(P)/FAD-dependent oxidoreductase [Nannocystis radixulma]MDC0666330.1 NAD(P)/FAD-dependent oxidoreductase [Nannocystis radixulma]
MPYDVIIIGGGPAGLSAALVLGRARKRVLLCDAGAPRNARAEQIHTFVTRDGTPPAEFRRIGREQLRAYPSVEGRDVRVAAIAREGHEFVATFADGTRAAARRILLAVGVRDILPDDLPGLRELWGHSVFQCPYCHGWEVQDRRFAYLSPGPEWVRFGVFLTGWSRDVVVLTSGAYAVDEAARDELRRAGVGLDERPLRRLVARDGELVALEFADGGTLAREVLFARPAQQQTELVQSLGLELDEHGFVRVDMLGRTSVAGIFAAGDLTTPMQGALLAAAAGMQAAAGLNHELTVEHALSGDAAPARPPEASRAPGGTGG